MCDQCGETFDMPSLLKQHYKNVHSVSTINRTCKTCGYEGKTTGSSSKSLHAHMILKHPDPTRLTCQICNHLSTSIRDTFVHFQVRMQILYENCSIFFVDGNSNTPFCLRFVFVHNFSFVFVFVHNLLQLAAEKKTLFLVGISSKFRPFLFCQSFSILLSPDYMHPLE